MKKMILAIAAMAIMSISASAAEVTGSILSTDIGTLIDGAPCKTYNVDGRTFVIAEDLRGYGFDVVYDDSIRRLTITQNPYSERTILSKEEINITKDSITVGQWLGDMFATDITVYLGDEQIEAYAIDGQMVIPVRALEKCAYVEYNDSHRLVLVNGLQAYLAERYHYSPQTMLYSQEEKNVKFYYRHTGMDGITLLSDSLSYDGVSKINVASINENRSIGAYWGNPYYIDSPSTRNSWCVPYYVEAYTIKDEHGKILYDAYIQRDYDLQSEEIPLSTYCGYLSTSSVSCTIGRCNKQYLYCTAIEDETSYFSYWPSLDNEENINIEKLSTYGNSFITDTGYLCSISGTPELIRYNISEQPAISYYLSANNQLYKAYKTKTAVLSNRTKSRFDECIEKDVKKMVFCTGDNTYLTLKTNGNIFYKNQHIPIAANVRDFSAASITGYLHIAIAAIDKNDDLYIAGYNDVGNVVDTDVQSAYVYDDRLGGMVYYLKNNGELYSYSLKTWSSEKIADNIRKIVNATSFITTNDELTDLTNVLAPNVKDASNNYILTNDNTIIDRTTGEQIFPQP